MRASLQGCNVALQPPIHSPVDDLAQYSPRRRERRFAEPEPFRFQTPLVFRLAPVV
jgi:hypothetical protein